MKNILLFTKLVAAICLFGYVIYTTYEVSKSSNQKKEMVGTKEVEQQRMVLAQKINFEFSKVVMERQHRRNMIRIYQMRLNTYRGRRLFSQKKDLALISKSESEIRIEIQKLEQEQINSDSIFKELTHKGDSLYSSVKSSAL